MTTSPTTPPVPSPAPVEFPASITDGAGPNWRRRGYTAAGVAIVIALVAGVGVARASGSGTGGYRTATVSTRDVESVLTGVGSIEPVSQVSVTFPVSGTVATVDVAVGQPVGTGQQLASLDPTSLTTALDQKQATLAQAELTLSKALSGASGASGGTATSGGSAGAASSGGTGTSSASPTGSTAVSDAQHAVVAAQHIVDTSLAAADQALAEAQQACSGASPTPPTTSTSTTTPTTTPGGGGGGGGTDSCLTAQQAVAKAQGQVAADQKASSKAVADLETALTQQASSGSSASRGTTASTGTSSAATARNTAGGSSTSAADLIADQAAVDAAAAQVAVAQQNLAATAIVSPISGTVAAVDLTVGASVSAGSTTANVIVVGQGGTEVTTPVSVDQISDVKVGQQATVLPDGATTPLPGQVVAIALAPTTGTRTTTYTVTIGLDDQGSSLFNGSTATVAITTAGATSVLAVPTSAVTVNGTTRTVSVLDGGATSTVTVKTGVVGSQWTQITEGLTAGQIVVIADLSQPLPGSATASTNGQTTTANRTGAATFPGAGPGGGFGGVRNGG